MDGKKERSILWTSGWDSTFRVLQLLDNEYHVKPYYVIDTERRSSCTEIKTTSKLRKKIEELLPGKAHFLGEINFFPIGEIKENKEITDSWKNLRAEHFFGGQYDWLARYAAQKGLQGLELAVHKDDTVQVFLESFVRKADDTFELDPEKVSQDVPKIFGHFNFPILHWTKVEMDKYSKKKGWEEIMNLTWFCHRPYNGEPCGICNPCRYTIQEGLGHRFTTAGRLRYKIRLGYDGVKYAKAGSKKVLRKFSPS